MYKSSKVTGTAQPLAPKHIRLGHRGLHPGLVLGRPSRRCPAGLSKDSRPVTAASPPASGLDRSHRDLTFI